MKADSTGKMEDEVLPNTERILDAAKRILS